MTLSERLTLIRAGYKKKEIESIEAAEAQAIIETAEAEEAVETTEAEEAVETTAVEEAIDYKALYEATDRELKRIQHQNVTRDISDNINNESPLDKVRKILKEN